MARVVQKPNQLMSTISGTRCLNSRQRRGCDAFEMRVYPAVPHMCATLARTCIHCHCWPPHAACPPPPTVRITTVLQAMLDRYSVEDRRFQDLDRALGDAVQLMRVSDARVHNLRKMHAMVLLQQCVPTPCSCSRKPVSKNLCNMHDTVLLQQCGSAPVSWRLAPAGRLFDYHVIAPP